MKQARQIGITARQLILLLGIVLCGHPAIAQARRESVERLSIGPFSDGRSAEHDLRAGDILSVVPESTSPDFALDLYVYNQQKVLVAVDPKDSNGPQFSWRATSHGKFYALARNVTGATGSWTVSIARGKGATKPQPSENYAIVRVFFGTNRQNTEDVRPAAVFGSEPRSHSAIQVGSCDVSIPRGHKMGEIEGPAILKLEFSEDSNKHVTLRKLDPENPDTFIKAVALQVARSKRREAFVFIHGFNTTFAEAARRTAQIAYDLGFDGAPILYSWPSQGEANPLAYNKDSRNSELSAAGLKEFLMNIVRGSGVTTLHLISHSMGSRPLSDALQQILDERGTEQLPIFKQVVFMAPDIDTEVFRKRAARIKIAAERVTLYASSKDEALMLSSMYAGYPRAGQGGPSIVVISGVDSIDASDIDTNVLGLSHQYYADNRTVLSDLFQLLKGEPINGRFGLSQLRGRDGLYFKFRSSIR
jgi:esterase/lipase superfamily enzyme